MDPWGQIAGLTQQELRKLQGRKLNYFLCRYVYPFSPFYQKLFKKHKIDPKKIKSVDDLKNIPLTSKKDFIGSKNSAKFRNFVLQPDQAKIRKYWPVKDLIALKCSSFFKGPDYFKDKLGREFRPIFITYTTGTTYNPIPYIYTKYDIDNLYVSGERMVRLFKMGQTDHLLNMFPYAPHLAFWQVVFGGLASCVLTLSTGGGKVMGTEGNLAAMLKMGPSVVIGVPSYVYHVLRVAKEKRYKLDSVKKIVLGAARITEGFKLRLVKMMESMGAPNVSVFGTYGFTEARSAWAECPVKGTASSGYHLYPDKEIFEVVNPETGEVKGEGEDGELVYTSLDSRGSSVIRYRTGDFVKGGIIYEPCPHCKSTVPRISSDITRMSDVKYMKVSKIKGSLVNLNNFVVTLSEFKEIKEWQVELCKKDDDPYEVDQLIVYISTNENVDQASLSMAVQKELLLTTEVSPNEIKFIPLEEMVKRLELETANKAKRIVDRRINK